jgi:uncharacterized protein YkwD
MLNLASRSAQSNNQPLRTQSAIEFKGLSQDKGLSQKRSRSLRRASAAPSIADLERSVFQKINQYRKQKGLATLKRNATINQQARQHSQTMATSGVLSHNGFAGRVKAISQSIPSKSSAENVAFNKGFSDPAAQAVNGWLKSSGHLKNIMGNFNLTGIGVARNGQGEVYFTQIFVRR